LGVNRTGGVSVWKSNRDGDQVSEHSLYQIHNHIYLTCQMKIMKYFIWLYDTLWYW